MNENNTNIQKKEPEVKNPLNNEEIKVLEKSINQPPKDDELKIPIKGYLF
jgi:hypothetical protein